MKNFRLCLAALLLTFMSTFSAAVVDRAVCSASDSGGTSCTVAQLKSAINEEVNAVDNRAPMDIGSASGTDTYLGSVTPTLTSYTGPQSFWFKPPNANTGASTLNINSIGAKALKSAAGAALAANDLVTTNLYLIRYYASGDEFRVVTSLGAGPAAIGNAFVTIGNTAALTAERALTAGAGLGLTDGGANSTATLAITDAELACILAQTSAADKISYWTGSGTCGLADFPSAFRTYLTTPSVANLAAVLSDEASGWATFNATPTVANLGAFLTNEASGWATFVVTPSMANLSAFLTDDASGWATFVATPSSANARALYTDEQGSGPAMFGVTAVTCSNSDKVSAVSAAGTATCAHVLEPFCVAISDETTNLSTGTGKATWRMPYAFTVTDVRLSVNTAPTGVTLLTVDVNEGAGTGTTILSTKLTLDASEFTSTTAATPRVISDSSLADDANMTADIDAVGSTITGKGAKVCLIGYQT